MKNMVSTIIVFGFVFIIILGGAFLFRKMNGLDTIKSADHRINEDIHKIIDAGAVHPDDNSVKSENSVSGTADAGDKNLPSENAGAPVSESGDGNKADNSTLPAEETSDQTKKTL